MGNRASSQRPAIITEDEVRECLTPTALISVLEQAFRRDFRQSVVAPPRLPMPLARDSLFLAMPCYDAQQSIYGVKLVSVGTGAERVRAEYVLYEARNRECLAVISANYLTDIRTACVSAIATKRLARPGAKVLGVFGTGRQARSHILALRSVLPLKAVLCCGSAAAKSEQFARKIPEEFELDAHACRPEECVAESDVICCCTTSSAPLFDGSLIRSGTHLNLVGTFEKGAKEVDGEALRRSRVFVESYDGVLSEGGDIATALSEGTLSRSSIVADLHELLTASKAGREHSTEITLFKSVGHAYEDLVAATLVYEAVGANSVAHRGA
jgi:ornithine cyclodeaminase/alanine dehydrogenase-like protein (mu-crystallin family)